MSKPYQHKDRFQARVIVKSADLLYINSQTGPILLLKCYNNMVQLAMLNVCSSV